MALNKKTVDDINAKGKRVLVRCDFNVPLKDGGMIMIMLGICGEYIGRIYISLNSSPQYVIRDTYHLYRHPLRGSETAYLDKE